MCYFGYWLKVEYCTHKLLLRAFGFSTEKVHIIRSQSNKTFYPEHLYTLLLVWNKEYLHQQYHQLETVPFIFLAFYLNQGNKCKCHFNYFFLMCYRKHICRIDTCNPSLKNVCTKQIYGAKSHYPIITI